MNHHPTRAETLDAASALGSAVAHELRNLLASAVSSIFLARRDIDRRERLLEHLASAENELQRSQDVIERVLNLVRGEPIQLETMRIADIVAVAQRNVRDFSVPIDVDVQPADLEVSCEPLLVERLITNLLTNAAEALAGSSSGHIIVRVRPDEHGFVLEVQDNGPGIDPVIAERIFEPGVTTKSTGTGLGLALCRAIVRVHGGDLLAIHAPAGGTIMRCLFGRVNESR